MYDLMNKNKGAISIFLVIVLVPMLILSSIFVDMSRIRMAKAVSTSAGDLTLNTALTNYDAVLKEMYGLFATSQDTDELFENLENYYRDCIESAGIPDVEAENYVDQIMSLIKSETGTDDLLNMNLTSFEVEKPTGSNLANPAVLKSQIVEFMKYRAPINLGTSLIEALGSMKNLKKQTALVEDKNEFYSAHASMMERLEKVWNNIEDYQFRYGKTTFNGDTLTFPNGDLLSKAATDLNGNKASLQTAISNTVRYLYFADSYNISKNEAEGYGVSLNSNPDDEKYTEIWTVSQTDDTEYKIEKEPSKTSVSTVKANLKTAYKAIQNLKKNNEVANELSQGNANLSDTAKIKIVSTTSKSLGTSYHNNIKELVRSLVELKNSFNGCEDDLTKHFVIVNDNGTLSFTEDNSSNKSAPTLKSFIESQFTHLKTDGEYIRVYNGLMPRVSGYWNDTHKIVEEARKQVANATKSAYTDAKNYDTFLAGRIDLLAKAISDLNSIKGDIDPSNTTSDYNIKLAAWKKSANGLSSDSMGKADLSEIEKLEKVLTVSKIEKLVNRLTAAKTSLEAIKSSISQHMVLTKKWLDIGENTTYKTLQGYFSDSHKSTINAVTPSSSHGTEKVNNSNDAKATYDKAYDTIISTLKGTVLAPDINTTWQPKDNPDLTKEQIELYTWLYNNFYTSKDYGSQTFGAESTASTTSKVTNGKDDADAAQEKLDNTNDKKGEPTKGTVSGRDLSKEALGFLPSGEWVKAEKEIKEAIAANTSTDANSDTQLSNTDDSLGVLDKVLNLLDGMSSDLRDNMYVANYIMNMFSYSTFESEITNKYGEGLSLGAFESWYTENKAEDGTLSYKLKDKYNVAQLQDRAQTLTNVSINPNANYLYGQEIEYIIYGGTNAAASSYGTIYMLRFALNTVYAFTDAEIGNITTSAATALFGTPPLTPLIPVAKIAFTIGLSLAESAWDLYELKSGEEVPLMKNKDTWMMKPTSAAKALAGEAVEAVANAAIDKGCEVLNDALEKTDEELNALISDTEGEFKNFLDGVANSTIGEIQNHANDAVQELVNICNNINLLAMENKDYVKGKTDQKIQQASEALDAWLAEQNTGDIIYDAKKIAVDYMKSNSGEVIGVIFDTIAGIGVEAGTSLADAINDQLKVIQTRINGYITNLSNTAGNALYDLKNQAMTEIKEAAKNGAESLRSKLKEKIGATFGTTNKSSGTTSVVSSLLSWAYSDYLQLFLVIGMVNSPEALLLRTADVIELNMQTVQGNYGWMEQTKTTEVSRLWGLIKYNKTETETVANASAYKLSNAYTHLKIKATIEVRPLLMTLPLMADTVKSQLTGTNWYQIQYEGVLGY